MSLDPKVIDARNEVEAKRAKLMHSVSFAIGEAKRRLAPDLIFEQAWEATKEKGAHLADDAVDLAKRRPWLVGGIATGLALFFARKPVGKLAVNTYDKLTDKDEAEAADDALEQEAPSAPVAAARRAKRLSPKKDKSKVEKIK